MEIELGPAPRYNNVRSNAQWTRAGIDTTLRVSDYNISDYKSHLLDCEKNPTVGLLARKKYITGKPMHYPEAADRNISYIKRQPEVDFLEKSFKNKIDTLYPKTKHIREYIIDNNRVILDGTKKAQKYTLANKLAIIIKRFVH